MAQTDNVNHPAHYNSRTDGIECIDIIRHYTYDIGCAVKYLWRAGLKSEQGLSDREKKLEDLHKALWYVNDYRINGTKPRVLTPNIDAQFTRMTGHKVRDVCNYYPGYLGNAIADLLCVGLIVDGETCAGVCWRELLDLATENIEKHIREIEAEEEDQQN